MWGCTSTVCYNDLCSHDPTQHNSHNNQPKWPSCALHDSLGTLSPTAQYASTARAQQHERGNSTRSTLPLMTRDTQKTVLEMHLPTTYYHPINLDLRYSKVERGRALVHMSPSCSRVAIFNKRIPRFLISSQNQIVLVW